jgi:iron(III) transport system permease protein
MRVWRGLLLTFLLLLAGGPVACLLLELGNQPEGWRVWHEVPRLTQLAIHSGILVVGTLVLVLPAGITGAVLLFRTDLPGRRLWRFLAVLSLFIPLPLITSAWQMAGGMLCHGAGANGAWAQGFASAIAIHSLTTLPWVIILVGLGLTCVEPELEDDALTGARAWRVILCVSIPRASASVALAALWVALLTLNEITTVTDTLVVRTFAEEVYYQFTGGSAADGARAVAVSLPAVVLVAVLTWMTLARWRRTVVPRQTVLAGPRRLSLGAWRWPLALFMGITALVLIGIPISALVWKAGLRYGTVEVPGPPTWEVAVFLQRFGITWVRQLGVLRESGIVALGTGAFVAFLAALLSWLIRGSARFERTVWLLAAVLWAMPGPLLGIGLHAFLQELLELDPTGAIRRLCWEYPSPLPNIWLCTLRYFPVALAALWPLVRLLPSSLEEAAVLDGATPWQRFSRVFLPAMRWPVRWTALGVSVLSLGEIGGSKLVTTPNFKTLAQHVFEQMHWSADSELAALCLVLLCVAAMGGACVAIAARWLRTAV